MARRATNPEIIAALEVMCQREAEVSGAELERITRECARARWDDYTEFDWREYAVERVSEGDL
jgi:hypothetical protein